MSNLEKELERQVGEVKGLVSSLLLDEQQKTNLLHNIHRRRFLVSFLPLDEQQVVQLNKIIGRVYDTYDRAYNVATNCRVVSDLMSEQVEAVSKIWDYLAQP